MRAALLLLTQVIGFVASAQGTERSLLWRIRPAEGTSSSYLYGTVHSRDARAYRGNDSLWAAFGQCPRVVGELDLSAAMQGAGDLVNSMMMPAGTNLEDLYRKKDFAQVEAALKEHLGVAAFTTDHLKPFWSMALLSEAIMRSDSTLVLDDYLQKRALAEGKEVLGLETVAEQMAAIQTIPLKEQAQMLLDMVQHDLYRAEMDQMMDAYAAQDLQKVMEVAEAGGIPQSLDKSLLQDRNARMATGMDSLMRSGPSCFFAVGAAHLPGEQGILAELREKGFAVEAVAPAP
ncbi:MAG: TraB/GumN family protein [Flavobacteriales bacterium]|nr:TraB/GumN family protein [Flavobacteriales bacterium]